jgi:hypothetical protein
MFRRHLEAPEMTPLKTHPNAGAADSGNSRPLRPWPTLVAIDKAPPPKPLIMGGTLPPRPASSRVQTRWQPGSMPVFPIAPANDPVRHLADDARVAMALLTLVLCVTVTVALLGFGLQVLQ